MKVIVLVDSLGPGGAEQSTAAVVVPLAESGVDVSVLLLKHVDDGYEADVTRAGVPVRVLASHRTIGRVRELRQILRADTPDILHTALYASDQIGRVAAVGLPVRTISTLVNVPPTPSATTSINARLKGWLAQQIDKLTGRALVDRFHAVTPGVASEYVARYGFPPDRITVVERGRDGQRLGRRSPTRRAQVRSREGWADTDEVVIAVGRHESDKAHLDLIDATALLASTRPDLRLVIAGRRGTTSSQIEEAINRLGLAGRVALLGHRDDVADLVAAADVLASASTREGAAGAVIEAFAIGTPVVSTRLAGLTGVLADARNSLTVPTRRPTEMATALRRLLDDPVLAGELAARARHDFEKRFTIERVATAMAELYDDVAAERRR